MDIIYTDNSYVTGTTYYNAGGTAIGTVDAEGNIWSNDGNNTFLGNTQADANGLPAGGSIAAGENSTATATTTTTSPGSSNSSTTTYVNDAINGLGDITTLLSGITGKKPATTGAKPATASTGTSVTTYFIIGIVVVIVIGVGVFFMTKKEKK